MCGQETYARKINNSGFREAGYRDQIIFAARIFSFLSFIVLFVLCGAVADADAEHPRKANPGGLLTGSPASVLVINSYHKGYGWSESITRGIEETLHTATERLDIWFEYIEGVRFPSPEYRQKLVPFLRDKFKDRTFDVIIVSDNDAFDFVLDHRDDLFAGVPVVFCGVNNFAPEMLRGQTDITGIEQYDDIASTIDLALTLHWQAERIITITAPHTTGTILHRRVKEIAAKFEDRVEFEYWHGKAIEDVVADVGNLDQGTILFTFGSQIDRLGEPVPGETAIEMISAASPAPVYTSADSYLGHGVVGGHMQSGVIHGRTAASYALEILRGRDADDIPVLTKGVNPFMFDYPLLLRFGIDPASLPKGSIIVNQPETTFERYRTYLWAALAVIAVLGVFVAALVFLIVKRRRAELALRVSEERLQAILDHSPAAVSLKSLDGRYVLVNREFTRRYGINSAAFIGKRTGDLFPPERTEMIETIESEVMATGSLHEHEFVDERSDGTVNSFVIVKFPVFDTSGKLRGIGGITTDVTDVKKASEAMRSLQAELAHVSRLSTMGEMAAGFAHELNQPLASIANYAQGCAQRMRSGSFDTNTIVVKIDLVVDQAHRASEIIKRIRGFVSNKDTRRLTGEFPVLDINPVVRAAIGLLVSEASRHAVNLRADLAASKLPVRADSIQIQQLIINLARNGMEAMSGAGSQPRNLTIRAVDSGEGTVIIEVMDTGPGIAEDVLPHLFHPFFTTKETGMGMGLSICRSIAENHGGRLTAENRHSGGALFRLTVPAAA
jgi:two-component system, cell cycle sensor histidine kinase and response regulator CckA